MTEDTRRTAAPEVENVGEFGSEGAEVFTPERLPATIAPGGAIVVPAEPLEQALTYANQKFEALQKITLLALKRTHAHDWTDFDGTPFLCSWGAERIRPLFGIRFRDVTLTREDRRDNEGPWYLYNALGTFEMVDAAGRVVDSIVSIGECSSRDRLYAQRTNKQTGETYWLPMEKVVEANVRSKAFSSLVRNGVTRMLGLRNLTWDLLRQYGFERGKSPHVSFTAKADAAAPRQAQAAREPVHAQGDRPARRPTTAAPPDGNSWFTSLQAAVAHQTGEAFTSEKSLALLRTITAFTPKDGAPFPGYSDWAALARNPNVERAAQVAAGKLREYTASLRAANRPDEPAPAPGAVADAPAGSPPPAASPQHQTTLINGVPVGDEPPPTGRERETMNGGKRR